jgi:Fe-S-cluster-containing hydrogenase component 2/DNA-binding Lrp family transcriptional regulator
MSTEKGEDPYQRILNNMKEYPQGIPMRNGEVSESFKEYIKLLFTPKEAKIAQYLKTTPQSVTKLSKKLQKPKEETKKILEEMTDKGIIQDIGGYSYFITMAHLLNVGYKYSKAQERLGEKGAKLYEEFFIHDGFYKRYESSDKGTSLMRVIPINKSIERNSEILNIEEVHQIIEDCQKPIVITDCPCRKRTEILGKRECHDKYPIEESCFQLGLFGKYFLDRGEGRKLTTEEAHEILDRFAKLGLIFTTENSKAPNHQVLCCCCDCCCSLLRGMTRFEDKNQNCVAKSNYVSHVDKELCKGCGLCVDRCVFNAIILENEKSYVNENKCYGCGVCAVTCPTGAIKLHKEDRNKLFKTSFELNRKIYVDNRRKD